MAVEVWAYKATITAGTPQNAPLTINLNSPKMPVRRVEWIEIVVPPGPRGVMGFALGAAGSRVIPSYGQAWIVTDDDKLRWDLEGVIESGAWQVFGYNTGTFDHSIYLRFGLQLPPAPTGSSVSLLDISTLGDTSG